MESPDLSQLTSAFVGGATTFKKALLQWKLRQLGIQVRTNVKTPQAMAKLSAVGGPQPYRLQDDFDNNGVQWTDRILTVFQSKWDFILDPEEYRNTYLAELPDMPFEAASVQHVADSYLDSLIKNTLYLGVRNAAGVAAADICDGWGTIIANEIIAGKITPIATGSISSANAVTKVEQVAEAVPEFMRDNGFTVFCSYATLDAYKKHYRTLNAFGFSKSETGKYQLDGINATLQPAAFMGNSSRLIATYPQNLVFGCDAESIAVHPTQYLNILKVREMMPAGCEIQDLDVLVVNDQA